MKPRSALWLSSAACVLLVSGLAAASYQQLGSKSASFHSSGPGGLAIDGKTQDVTVLEKDGKLTVSVKLTHLSTGIELRDSHMRDKYLEVGKYPDARFVVDVAALPKPNGGKVEGDANGQLTVHGVTNPAKAHFVLQGPEGDVAVTGHINLKLPDYKIEVPSYFGVTVKPDVSVAVSFHVADK